MDRFTCPCGRIYRIVEEGRGEMKRGLLARLIKGRHGNEFDASYPWEPSVAQPVPGARFASPPRTLLERPHILARYFDLNWRHALASGFFAALCLGLLYAPSALEKNGKWYNPFIAAGVTFSLVSAIVWGLLIFFDRKGLDKLERSLGIDINRDGSIGEPRRRETPVVRIEVTRERGRITEFDDLPADDVEQLIEVAQAFNSGASLSRRGLSKSTNLSEDEADLLLAEMRKLGYARFKKGRPNLGTELTKKGDALFSGLLST